MIKNTKNNNLKESLMWCEKQKTGIKIIEPNENLSKEYLKNAKETLIIIEQIKNSNSNMWLATQKYYFEYFLAYSILMKIGIKSEIHSCTIEIIKILEELKIIKFDFSSTLERDKEKRIENQYYLKNIPININIQELRNILLKIREILNNLNENKIQVIRNKLFSE